MTQEIEPFSEAEKIGFAIFLISMSVIGIIENVTTITVIIRSKKLKSIFYLFIVSLCVSDLTSAIASPLYLYRLTWGYLDWNAPVLLCKLFWGIDMCTTYVTTIHILCFASLRFTSIQWPQRFKKIKKKHAKICIISIWVWAFCIGFIPFSVWFGKINKTDLNYTWPSCTLRETNRIAFYHYCLGAFSVLLYFPMFMLFVLQIAIRIKIALLRKARSRLKASHPPTTEGNCISINSRESDERFKRKESFIVIQLVLIVSSYLLGYIPFSVYDIIAISIDLKPPPRQDFKWWPTCIVYFTLRLSECLNTIFYNLASGKLRNETITQVKAFCSQYCCCDSCCHQVSDPHITYQRSA